jgi:CheY-like chemotaxis protein
MSKATILLAEDEAMLRLMAADTLEECGFQVLAAPDGIDALDLLKVHSEIALLISDIRMPRMDGYALAAASLAFRPELKVIFMTGYAHNPPAALAARNFQVLRKPFNFEELCSAADGLLADGG